MRAVALAAACAVLLLPLDAPHAQVRPDTSRGRRPGLPRAAAPGRRDTLRVRRDSATADTTRQRVRWPEPDSVMTDLLGRPGYTVTRYQADTVIFDAETRTLRLSAGSAKVAAVQRDSQLVVTDSGIVYGERSGQALVCCNNLFRDPGRSQADLTGRGLATYNLRERSATVRGGRTEVQSGENWYISWDVGKVLGADSAAGRPVMLYGLRGNLTSCDDTVHGPHYHFHFREIKRRGNFMVARPAILYIADVPVFWLPFIFQDMRSGRRSGVLTPRFGVSDIVRNSPTYRRHVENVGYYWALNDYMDLELSFDWRSGTGGPTVASDPGWMRFNGQWQYNWLSRFLSGSIGSSYTTQNDGNTNLALSWAHRQSFSRDRNITANLNYVSSTTLQRQNSFNPYSVLATIRSQANYSDRIGPFSLQLGGTRTQYPGREQVDQILPTLSLASAPINLARWLIWTPSLQYNDQRSLNIDQPGLFGTRVRLDPQGTVVGLDTLSKDSRNTTASFETPLQIHGYNLGNSFRFTDREEDFPQQFTIIDVRDTSKKSTRIFARTFRTELDWTPSFSLPPLGQGRWNLSPNVSLQNVYGGPLVIRSERSNGQFVTQSKRATFGLGVSPTVYGLWPGFGRFSRLRHTLAPSLTYTFAPKADVSDQFLAAVGESRNHWLGNLAQNSLTFGLTQNIEGKVRSPTDTNPDAGRKVKLLSLNFTSLTYDFERARKTGKAIRGLTTPTWGFNARSDLLPNVDVGVDYSLFSGAVQSDTARFSPFRESVRATFSINQRSNPFAILARLFGRAVPANTIPAAELVDTDSSRQDETRRLAVQPVAGTRARAAQFVVPAREGWEASFSFTSTRQRPPTGNVTIIEFQPELQCQRFRDVNPVAYQQCVENARTNPPTQSPIQSATLGSAFTRIPPVTSLQSSINFHLTPKWAASWQTTYDFEAGAFGSHIVSLQRDLHDWRAVFAFTQAPNGNFAFNFFIALKAQPDLKFDYSRATYRSSF
jgi:hypothetical protein